MCCETNFSPARPTSREKPGHAERGPTDQGRVRYPGTRRSSPLSKVPVQSTAEVYWPELAAIVEHRIEG